MQQLELPLSRRSSPSLPEKTSAGWVVGYLTLLLPPFKWSEMDRRNADRLAKRAYNFEISFLINLSWLETKNMLLSAFQYNYDRKLIQ